MFPAVTVMADGLYSILGQEFTEIFPSATRVKAGAFLYHRFGETNLFQHPERQLAINGLDECNKDNSMVIPVKNEPELFVGDSIGAQVNDIELGEGKRGQVPKIVTRQMKTNVLADVDWQGQDVPASGLFDLFPDKTFAGVAIHYPDITLWQVVHPELYLDTEVAVVSLFSLHHNPLRFQKCFPEIQSAAWRR